MPKGNSKFTKRLRVAVDELLADADLDLRTTVTGSLFSPIFTGGGKYRWAKVMDSDGLLVAPRRVVSGEGGSPAAPVELLVGVIIQAEDATSQTKPNPLGKASLAHIPNGIWIDVLNEGRRRLDRVHVLLVLPKGVAPKHQKKFATAKRNVENAAAFMPDAETLAMEGSSLLQGPWAPCGYLTSAGTALAQGRLSGVRNDCWTRSTDHVGSIYGQK
jgi:hypothetical protein